MKRNNILLIILIIFLFLKLISSQSVEERLLDLERQSIEHYKEIIQKIRRNEMQLDSIINQKELKSNYLHVSGFKFVLSGLVLWTSVRIKNNNIY